MATRYPLTEQNGRAGSDVHQWWSDFEDLNNEAMRFGGRYDPDKAGGYRRNHVVWDGDFLQISTIDGNTERPAPQPSGAPIIVSEIPGTPPAWTNESATESAWFLVLRVTIPATILLTSLRYYFPTGSEGFTARMWGVVDPVNDGPKVQLIPSFAVTANLIDQWTNFPINSAYIPGGTTFDLVLVVEPRVGETTWQAEWDAKRSNGEPSQGEAWHQSGSGGTRFHHIDKNDTDRTALLQSLQPGDRFMVSGVSYEITSTLHNANDVQLYHTPTTRPSASQYTYTFTQYGDTPIPYVRVPSWFSGQPNIKGYAGASYDSNIVVNDDLYGVDFQFEELVLPENWNTVFMR